MYPEASDEVARIRKLYNTVYHYDPADYTYTWHPRNRVSLYYRHAQEQALVTLLNAQQLHLEQMMILDVGCGKGNWLRFLLSLGARPENLHGIDLMAYRIAEAKTASPASMHYNLGEGQALPYPTAWFDLVSQFTVYSSVFDVGMQHRMAAETLRVLKPGGYVLWYDMRHAHTTTTRGIERKALEDLFPNCVFLALKKLHPPHAAALARRSNLLITLWTLIPGPRKTHYLALLQKPR